MRRVLNLNGPHKTKRKSFLTRYISFETTRTHDHVSLLILSYKGVNVWSAKVNNAPFLKMCFKRRLDCSWFKKKLRFKLFFISGESQLFSFNLKGWHFLFFLAKVMVFGMLYY